MARLHFLATEEFYGMLLLSAMASLPLSIVSNYYTTQSSIPSIGIYLIHTFLYPVLLMLSMLASIQLDRSIVLHRISSAETLSQREQIRNYHTNLESGFNIRSIVVITIPAVLLSMAAMLLTSYDHVSLENWGRERLIILLLSFGTGWISNFIIYFLMKNSNEGQHNMYDDSSLEQAANDRQNQPSQSHTQRNQNRPRNNRPQRTRTAANNPRVPLIAPPTATTSPIPTYGSFSQPEPQLPDYESLLAPPPPYAEITKETNQPPNHPQPPLDTTLNPISMLLYPSLSALFRPSPMSSEYIALEEGSQQSADDNSAPSPSAPLLSEEESQQSADDDSVPSPSAPPFFP